MPTQEAGNTYLLGYLERLEHPVAYRSKTSKNP
jgi:hypothetical protein